MVAILLVSSADTIVKRTAGVGFGGVEVVYFTFPFKLLLFHSVFKTVRLDVLLMRVGIGWIEKF